MADSNILWIMSESFSPDDDLDSCMVWQSEMYLEKARCLYLSSHEGS